MTTSSTLSLSPSPSPATEMRSTTTSHLPRARPEFLDSAKPLPFPGRLHQPSQAHGRRQHRCLWIPGSEFTGSWTNNQQYYQVDSQKGTLHCDKVWWLELGSHLCNVPAGEWEAYIYLKHRSISKAIDWELHVDHPDDDGVVLSHHETSVDNAFDEHDSYDTWAEYAMGRFRVLRSGSRIGLSIVGTEGHAISNITYGGLELRACGIGWEQEQCLWQLLMAPSRAPVPSSCCDTDNEEDDPNKNEECSISNSNPQPSSTLPMLPKVLIGRIGQYLITPLANETLLLH